MATKNDKVNIIVGAKDQTKNVLGGIKNQVIGIGAAYLGWRGVTSIISSITDAGREHEKVWNDVAASLERHGVEVDSNLKKIQKFSDEMQTMSGESDEAVGKMVQSFVDYGQTVEEAMDTTKVAMDLAAGAGMELKAASDLLAKAAVGYTGTLSRYGIIIDESIPKSEKFAAAIDQINDRFGGAAQSRIDTYDVKMKLLNERFGDMQEQIFKLISPSLLSGVNVLTSAVTSMIDVFTPDTIDEFIGKTVEVQEVIPTTVRSVKDFEISIQGLTTTFASFFDTLDGGELRSKFWKAVVENSDVFGIQRKSMDEWTESVKRGEQENVNLFQAIKNEADGALNKLMGFLTFGEMYGNMLKKIEPIPFVDFLPEGFSFIPESAVDNTNQSVKTINEVLFTGQDAWLNRLTENSEKELEIQSNKLNLEAEVNQLYNDEKLIKLGEQIEAEDQLKIEAAEAEIEALNDKYNRIHGITSRFTSSTGNVLKTHMQDLVSATDTGTAKIGDLWNDLGKSIRSTIIDVIVDSMMTWATSAIAKLIFGQSLEGASVKSLTAKYIALAAAKSAAQPWTAPGRIAAAAVTTGGLGFLMGAGFDDPINDAIARKHGRDYSREFMIGAQGNFESPGFGRAVVGSLGYPQAPQSSGGNVYNLHFHAPVTNRQFVDDEIIPAIEESISQGRSNITINDSNLTGNSNVGTL